MNQKSSRQTYDAVAIIYDSSRFSTIRGRFFRILRSRILERLALEFPPSGKVFDLACGIGLILAWLIKKNYQIISGDLSRGMIEIAKNNLDGSGSLDGFLQLDATRIPIKSKAFDIVTSFRFLNLMSPEDRVRIHKEVSRICKQYYLITYALGGPYQRFRGKVKAILGISLGEGADLYPATIEEIRNELAQAGIEMVSAYPVCSLLTSEIIVLGKIKA